MARVPFTLRIDSEERPALQDLEEPSLEPHLANLRAYRKRDPGFRRAIAAFVEAEASSDDPLEGTVDQRMKQR
jgi:hypothetical protein